MTNLDIKLFFLYFLSVYSLNILGQQTNSLYFLESSTLRHKLNPSFQPKNDFYISIPIIGYTSINLGNNSISLKDIVYNENNKTVTFLSQQSSIDRFYNKLKANTVIRTNLQSDILGFGFHYKSSYLTFSLTENFVGTLSIPKDAFQLSFYGTSDIYNNLFNFTKLQTDFTVYTEAAFGFAKDVTPKLSIGGKFKILYGNANLSNTNRNFIINAGLSNWVLQGEGLVNYSSPVQINIGNNFQSFSYTNPTKFIDWLKPSGMGIGIDIGIDYHLNKNINFSASLLDLGFIHWNKNSTNLRYGVNYKYDGIAKLNSNSTLSTYNEVYNQLIFGNLLFDSISKAFNGSTTTNRTNISYNTGTTSKLNLGFEYNLDNQKVGFGILSHTQLFKNTFTEEITASVNSRPNNWLNASLSYSLFNGNLSSFGAGIGLKLGIVDYFATVDYIPFQKVSLPLSDINSSFPALNIPIPYNSRIFNFSTGLIFVFDYPINMQKNRLSNINEKFTGLKIHTKTPKKNSQNLYYNSDNTEFLKSKKGFQPKKSKKDCHCETK